MIKLNDMHECVLINVYVCKNYVCVPEPELHNLQKNIFKYSVHKRAYHIMGFLKTNL